MFVEFLDTHFTRDYFGSKPSDAIVTNEGLGWDMLGLTTVPSTAHRISEPSTVKALLIIFVPSTFNKSRPEKNTRAQQGLAKKVSWIFFYQFWDHR